MFNNNHHIPLLALFTLIFAMSMPAWAGKPLQVCGDGKCKGGETAASCPADCAAANFCGNGICDADETNATCPADCPLLPPPTCNNDTICNLGEDCLSCPGDCNGVTSGKPSKRYCCGMDGNCYTELGVEVCGASCSFSSTLSCGDSVTSTELGEECDDGGESSYCDSDCTLQECGDTTVNATAGEECDAGGETASCDPDCTFAACGDGVLNTTAGEACDDGNTDAGDGCDAFCEIEVPPDPFCGDGNLDAGEQCDDGNTASGDGCDADCQVESPAAQVPSNQFNIGDSIGEGEAADGTVGLANHQTVWSTGYDAGDSVNSLNERFESTSQADYYENNASRNTAFNHAVSGAVMADFAAQAGSIIAAVQSSTPPDEAGMISILLGNNDVCADTLAEMTNPDDFETQYRAGLDVLAGSALTSSANIHVSSIPGIYWLWNAKRNNFWCRVFAWPFVPCENLLESPADDCVSAASRLDPDNIHDGDGANCIRRKTFHAKIRDTYNPILRDVLQEYIGTLPNAKFVDIFDAKFEDSHVNGGDCFHPSDAGHALLSDKEWCNSQWGADDVLCTQ